MIEIADIDRILRDRSLWGRGYNNMLLESKRRSAILWLRLRSKKGWVMDHALKFMGEMR